MLSVFLLVACAPEASFPTTAGPTALANQAPVVSSSMVQVTPQGGAFQVDGAVVNGAPGTGTYAFSWEGERFEGSGDAWAVNDGSSVSVFFEQSTPLSVGPERIRWVTLTLPGASVAAGSASLFYAESGDLDRHVLDVLLRDTVQAEVLDGDGSDGTPLSVRVEQVEPVADELVGAAVLGELFEGPYSVAFESSPMLDCGSLTPDQLDFVSEPPSALGVLDGGYVGVSRAYQSIPSSQPFSLTGGLVNALTSVDGTRPVIRLPGIGGQGELRFADSAETFGVEPSAMETRLGPDGLAETARVLTVDASEFDAGIAVSLVRVYGFSPGNGFDDVYCEAGFDGVLTPR